MRKAERDLVRMAEDEGLQRVAVIPSMPHARLIGEVDGHRVEIVMSLTKAFATPRCRQNAKLNIRRKVREIRAGEAA